MAATGAKRGRKPRRRREVRGRIEAMIRDGALWGQRLPGYRDLAADLGVSGQTVQTVLAELEVEGVVERRHGSGTYVREEGAAARRKTGRLVVVSPVPYDEHRPGWDYSAEVIRGIRSQSGRVGVECTYLYMSRHGHPERAWDASEMREHDGFVLVNIPDSRLASQLLGLRRGPVVVIDRHIAGLPVIGIFDDSFGGARAVTRHLLKLGHRRIAYVDYATAPGRETAKYQGYRAALEEAGVRTDAELEAGVRSAPPERRGLDEFVDSAVERLLAMAEPPTALFGYNDRRALAAIAALEKRGRKVGKDIAVAGFGDTAYRTGTCRTLTSCRIYTRKFGEEAVKAALGEHNASEGRTVIVPTRLFVRESTCPPAGD
ncbi:MAG: LacI family DNA-binding transcriptional regulator [Planctomycetota bacterium]|jgi:LacI family transcriptional regulator